MSAATQGSLRIPKLADQGVIEKYAEKRGREKYLQEILGINKTKIFYFSKSIS